MISLGNLFKSNSTYTNEAVDRVLIAVGQHKYFNTCITLADDKGVYAFCRWNIITESTAEILDCIIREDYRGKGVIFDITRKGLEVWPDLKYLVFERGYDDGKQIKRKHKISIKRFMRRQYV